MINYNLEQLQAIESCTEFINNGNPKEYFLIEGKAGTGKTTVIKDVIKTFRSKLITVGALSHKAKYVVKESIEKEFKNKNIVFSSIAGMLNLQMDLETGIFKKDYNVNSKSHISNFEIVIIDEASMVNEEMISMIFKEKRHNSKVIFLGDIGQLPPIRTKDNPYYMDWTEDELGKNSPIFDTKNKSKLLTRVRQGEESPILPFADFFWENSQKENPSKNPTNLNDRKTIINNKGALIFVNESKEIFKNSLELFDNAIKNNIPNLIKFVTYRNKTKNLINQYIHRHFFGNDCNTFQKGELIIFNDNFDDIENSSEFQIIHRYEDFIDNIDKLKLYSVDIIFEEKIKQIVLLHPDSINDHDILIKRKFKEAFETKKELDRYSSENIYKQDKVNQAGLFKTRNLIKEKYKKQLKDSWEEKKRFPNIDYAYSISTHKAQGSTYETVIVHEQDIMNVSLINNKQKSQSIYTALTRGKNMCIVISTNRIYNDINVSDLNLTEINNKINNK